MIKNNISKIEKKILSKTRLYVDRINKKINLNPPYLLFMSVEENPLRKDVFVNIHKNSYFNKDPILDSLKETSDLKSKNLVTLVYEDNANSGKIMIINQSKKSELIAKNYNEFILKEIPEIKDRIKYYGS